MNSSVDWYYTAYKLCNIDSRLFWVCHFCNFESNKFLLLYMYISSESWHLLANIAFAARCTGGHYRSLKAQSDMIAVWSSVFWSRVMVKPLSLEIRSRKSARSCSWILSQDNSKCQCSKQLNEREAKHWHMHAARRKYASSFKVKLYGIFSSSFLNELKLLTSLRSST